MIIVFQHVENIFFNLSYPHVVEKVWTVINMLVYEFIHNALFMWIFVFEFEISLNYVVNKYRTKDGSIPSYVF